MKITPQQADALHEAVASDLLPALPDPLDCENGYWWIEKLRGTGWKEVAGLDDGSLLGDWPYQVVAHYADPERELYGLAVYTEGDVSVEGFRTREARDEATRAYAEEDGE
ncbi:hypothetical protein [Streptomyces sp. 4F14]|uniref:hypothetical protein n=1 Tax=Streptomyces sp. 4F14 TaxID=3394380 RepID=UPI003A8842D5